MSLKIGALALALGCRVVSAQSTVVLDPAAAILDAFRTHSVVLLGDVHGSAEFHAFARALIASPRFRETVDDVVLEATNVRYQPILDRYIAGDSVPRDSLRLVWRNSTQLMLWDSPLYEELVETIRDVNQRSGSRGHKLRALTSDPPIDWSHLNTAADFPRSYGYRDWQTTAMVEREVLARRRKALVIIGNVHIGRTGPRADSTAIPAERESLGVALARKHPGVAYVVYSLVGDSPPDLSARVRSIAPPVSLVRVAGTKLGSENSSLLFGKSLTLFRTINGQRVATKIDPAQMPALSQVIDAILYLGPYSHTVSPNASLYLSDSTYLNEVRRRIRILSEVYGGDFWSDDLNAVLGRGTKQR